MTDTTRTTEIIKEEIEGIGDEIEGIGKVLEGEIADEYLDIQPLAAFPTPIEHIIVIVFENKEVSTVLDQGPYFKSLSTIYGFAENYFAVCHPSAPNYLAMTSGKPWQCGSNSIHTYQTLNVGDLLTRKSLTWYGFFESMPIPCDRNSSGLYVSRHNPFIFYADIVDNPTRCKTHVVPLTVWNNLVSQNKIPNFSFIVPNLNNSGHDTNVAYADRWLKSFLSPLLTKPWFSKSVFFIVFDEGQTNKGFNGLTGGHIYMSSVSPYSKGLRKKGNVTHYNLLTTIEWLFNLDSCGNFDNPVQYPPMKVLFKF